MEMNVLTIGIGILTGIIIMINPMVGLLITIALIPQSLLQAMGGSVFGIFTGATPIKIIGGITFLSVFIRYIFGSRKERFLQIPQVKFFAIFLIYMYITGFAMLGFATRTNFTVFTSFAMLGLIILVLVKDLRRFRLIIWWGLISVFFACLSSILGYFGLDAARGAIRLGGTSYGPNEFAIGLLPFLGLSFACMFAERKKILKIIALGITGVIAFALLLTFSRAGLLGLGLMLIIAIIRAKKKLIVLLVLAITLFISVNIMPSYIWEGLEERIVETERTLEDIESARDVDSTKRRYRLAKAAWAVFLDNPIFGIGVGNYYYEFRKYEAIPAGRAHTRYLEVLAELGAVGFLLFMAIIWHTLRTLARMTKSAKAPVNYYAYGLYIGLIGFLVAAIFLHAQQEKALWFIVFMSAALWKISQGENSKEAVLAEE